MDAVTLEDIEFDHPRPDPIRVIPRTGGGVISYHRDENIIQLLDATNNRGHSHNYLMLPEKQWSRISAAFGNFWPVT